MPKELSKHASVILYLGIHYEHVLATRFAANGTDLLKRLKAAGSAIPREQQLRLKRFNPIRNVCAHEIGFQTLRELPNAIRLFNDIEDGFAGLLPDYKPDYVTEADFAHTPPSEKIVYVEVPSERTVYLHDFVLPSLVKVGLVVMAIALLIALFAGLTNSSSTNFTSGGFFGIGEDHYHTQTESPGALFWIVVIGGLLAIVGAIVHHFTKAPKREVPRA